MERVTGIGGVFFRSKDPKVLLEWYRAHLGIDHVEDSQYGRFGWAVDPEGNRFELWQPAA